MKPIEAIRCTQPNCPCECFSPGKLCLRNCETCKHGWVSHALDKLGYHHLFNLGMQVEVVQPNIVFDIASLMLYGSHATPVRLKILLDRLFSVLQHDEVLQVLHGFGWTYEDYARGYILQDTSGRVLDKWSIASREEEHIILQQFLRFGETKAIAQEIILQDTKEKQDLYFKQTSRAESEIKKFIERSNMSAQSLIRPFDARPLFAGRLPFMTPGSRLLNPPTLQPSYSPTREIRPLGMPTSNPASTSTSPLGHLQTMQPFEIRREQTSPAASPSPLDKPLPGPSPTSESSKNLSATPTSVHSAPSPLQSQRTLEACEGATMPSGAPITDDEHSVTAIDYSTKDDSICHDLDRKARHLRKSSNPIKRQWTPSAGFGSTFIGPNGKKRVLCTACNKTFCDKGALKIHYSAVHLKEMHKCSVDGCNMMFSSRRSRNRHSANPNPKLHMMQKRKDLPEGSRMLDEAKQSRVMSSPPTMVVQSSLLPRGALPSLDPQGLIRPDASYFVDMSSQFAYITQTPEKKARFDDKNIQEEDHPKDLSNHTVDDVREEERPELEEESKHENVPRGGNRRKSNAPTRCAQMEEMYVMSDDNSDDRDPTCGKNGSGRGRRSSQRESRVESENQSEEPQIKTEPKTVVQQQQDDEAKNVTCDEIECGSEQVEAESQHPPVVDIKQMVIKRGNSTNFPKIASLLTNSSPDTAKVPVIHAAHEGSPCSSNGCSDQESNISQSSVDSQINGILLDGEITLDKDNPRKCPTCGKMFQNHFGVKTHFQNVHLKLMHPCTIEGCNATFPSKRSRDRHSANLNLHRKLLSTSDSERDGDPNGSMQSLRDDVLQSLYGPEFVEHDQTESCGRNGHHTPTGSGSAGSECNSEDEDEDEEQDGHSFMNGDDSIKSEDSAENDSCEAVTCHICQMKFRDNLVLKEHFETVHPKEMFGCTVSGCDKIFSTRKSRNRHSQNDNLHRHLSPFKRNSAS